MIQLGPLQHPLAPRHQRAYNTFYGEAKRQGLTVTVIDRPEDVTLVVWDLSRNTIPHVVLVR